MDSGDIDWLMTLTDQQILDKILEDKLKLDVAIGEDSEIANTEVSGNTGYGVERRSMVGNLPRPDYPVNESEVVIVEITVDKNSDATKSYSEKGSTTTNTELINAAIRAAKNAKFDSSDKDEQVEIIMCTSGRDGRL